MSWVYDQKMICGHMKQGIFPSDQSKPKRHRNQMHFPGVSQKPSGNGFHSGLGIWIGQRWCSYSVHR